MGHWANDGTEVPAITPQGRAASCERRGRDAADQVGKPTPLTLGRPEAVRRYREDLLSGRLGVTVEDVRRELHGRDLACYCPLDEACHADVLLAVANE